MFGTIRRHQSWMLVVFTAIVAVSFVVFGPTNTRIGNVLGVSDASYGVLGGKPITAKEYSEATREAALGYLLRYGRLPQENPSLNASGYDLRIEAYRRLFFLGIQKKLGISVGEEAAAIRAKRILHDTPIDQFYDKQLKPAGFTMDDMERMLRHDIGLDEMVQCVGAPGRLVTTQEAETIYRKEHQDLQAQMLYFSYSNYLAGVTILPGAVAQYYTNKLANYRVPDRVIAEYVKFNVTNYLDKAEKAVTNLDQIADAEAVNRGTNFYAKTTNAADSKAAIRKDVIRQKGLEITRREAGTFSEELDNLKPRAITNLAFLAGQKGLAVEKSIPFDFINGPTNLDVLPAFSQEAFRTNEDFFSNPIKAVDGVYILVTIQRLPSEVPPLSAVEAKVTEDFRKDQAFQAAAQDALRIEGVLTNGMAAGKTFAAICAAEKVTPVTLPPFSISTDELPPQLEKKTTIQIFKQAAFATTVGKVSPVARAQDGGFIIYPEKLIPIDEAKMKQEFPAFLTYVRQARENDSFNQWLRKQASQDPVFWNMIQKISETSAGKGARASAGAKS